MRIESPFALGDRAVYGDSSIDVAHQDHLVIAQVLPQTLVGPAVENQVISPRNSSG